MHLYLIKLTNAGFLNRQFKITTSHLGKRFKKDKKELIKLNILNQIKKLTKFLPSDTPLVYRIRVLRAKENKNTIFCPVCGGLRKMANAKLGESLFYITCGTRDSEHKKFLKLIKSQKIKKFWGDLNQDEIKDIVQKREKTCLQKYGVTVSSQNNEVKEKMARTNLKRYGTKSPMQSKDIKNRAKITNLTKYGFTTASQTEAIRKKIQTSHLVPETNSNRQKKLEETNLTKYGVKSTLQLAGVRTKGQQTIQKKYGVQNYSHTKINIINYKKLSKNYIETHYLNPDGYFNIENFCKFINCNKSSAYKILKRFQVGYKPRNNKSEPEYQIIDLLELAVPGIEIVHGSRQIIKPLELDIYLPEYRLAIEFNGSLYHSAGKDNWSAVDNTLEEIQNKHWAKTKACQDKGIELIHIPEWWWNYDREYWERLVLSKIGVGELQKSSELSSSYELLGSNHPVILPELYSPLEWTQETLEQLIEEGKRVYFH